MGRAPRLSQHERGKIEALSTAGYRVKQIFYVVKRSRKAIMDFLRHQEEYRTRKSSGRPSKLNDREKGQFCGQRRIARQASMECVRTVTLMLQKTTVWRILDKCPNIARSQMKKCPQLT
uniref:HTH_Tnp_Tc3_1 domain-containing protein n=1 Tax=Heterorhabditis bacteriophora TaxID=37862 RepID=A0A1I7XKL2_HETBA